MRIKKPKTKNQELRTPEGFTLLEVLIYSGLVTVIVSFSLLATYQLIEFTDRGKHLRELAENQKLLEQKIYWALQSVSVINSPAAGATSTALSINKSNYGENPVVIDSLDSAARLQRASGTPQLITNDLVFVQDLNFHQFDFSGQPAIQITGTLFNEFTSSTAAIDLTILTK